jgi:hypothetical protein
MKISQLIVALLCFIGLNAFGQTISGKVTSVKPHFGGEYALTVGKETFVLLVDKNDKARKSFELNKEYKDILIQHEGKFILNPKYANQPLQITYKVNGKGWKCIQTIKPSAK